MMLPKAVLPLAVGVVFALSLQACADDLPETENNNNLNETEACVPVTTPVATITASQVMQILLNANDAEIAQAQLALQKATRPEVKAYAQRMITEHTAAKQTIVDLGQQAGITAESTPLSEQLAAEATQSLAWLATTSGEMFDLSYMDLQLKSHASLLFLGDSLLVPLTQSEPLKSALSTARGVTQVHLTDAVALQATLLHPGM